MRRALTAVALIAAMLLGLAAVASPAVAGPNLKAPSKVWVYDRGSGFLRVKWYSGYAAAGIRSYSVRVRGLPHITTGNQRATVRRLQPNTTYRIEVRVKDRKGNFSSWRATTGRTRPRPESSGGGGWTHPHPGAYSSSCYGPRWGAFHAGVDLVRSHRASVKSAHSGTVVQVGWNGGYGRSVVVNHGRYYTLYGHLDSVTVRTGQSVRAGQEVGKQGTTGDSTGSHLHFEVWDNGWYRQTNPASFMRSRGIYLGSCG